MVVPVSDDDFATGVLEAGLLTAEGLAAVRRELDAARQPGRPVSLGEALVQRKLLTRDRREKIEKRIRIARETIPERFGEFRLRRKLGEGGMGSVFLAEDATGRQVALKTLSKALSGDAEARARFKREATAASELDHPNIVRALAVGEVAGQPYYAMEFCEGATLEALLERGERFTPARVLEIATQVARGLECAHERGFVHRDIKPDNIFWTSDGRAKILDLGLSKNLRITQTFQTMGGTALGTPNYISTELAQGITDLDGRTDEYSLGATLHHLLTGEPPFDAPDFMKVLLRQIHEQLPDPREKNPQTPEGFVVVLTRMLAKDPDDRYPDLKAVREELERVRAGQAPSVAPLDPALSSLALRRGFAPPAARPAAAAAPVAPPVATPVAGPVVTPKRGVPWRVVWLIAAGVGALLLGAVLLILARR
jgi:serine/threonine protein kinase